MSAPITLHDALESRNTGWFANRNIVKLNAILMLTLISSYANGYDASMMNGLQSLDEWKAYFDNPGPSALALQSALVGFFNAQWNSGAIVAAWTTYGTFRITNTWAWRIPSVLQALSSVIQIAACFMIVESPRWLISKDRDDEAQAIITKYHANGDPYDPIVTLEMEEIREAFRIDRDVAKNTSYVSFLKSKGNRLRLLLVVTVGFFSQWSGNGLISYYLTLILDSIGYTPQGTQTLTNAVLAIWSLVSTGFVAFFVVDRFNKRALFLVSTAGMLISFVVWTALEATYEKQTEAGETPNPSIAKAVLAMIVLYNTSFNIGWTPLQVVYVTEIMPFQLRARGLVLYSFAVAIALIFNQYVNPIALSEIGWRYYIVYDVWLLFELIVVYFVFIETRGSSLEEISLMIDGPELKVKMIDNVAAATSTALDEKRDATTTNRVERV